MRARSRAATNYGKVRGGLTAAETRRQNGDVTNERGSGGEGAEGTVLILHCYDY